MLCHCIQVDRVIRSKDMAALTLEYAMKLPPFLALFVTEAKAPFKILVANKRYRHSQTKKN